MKRIFMLSRQAMFSQGVEHLLSGQRGLIIIDREADVEAALVKIQAASPDVVIIDSKDMESAPAATITSILKVSPCSKIITLNLENDQMRVYLGQQRSARTVNDLLEVVYEEMPGSGQISDQEWANLASGRARAYGFQASVFNRQVDPALLENLGLNSVHLITSFEQVEDLTGDLHDGVQDLERFMKVSTGRPMDEARAALISEHSRLLQPPPLSGSPLLTCETDYLAPDISAMISIRARLQRFYVSAGWALDETIHDQPDFIACELAFMQVLCSAEAAAWERGERRQAISIQALEATFVKEHLVRWVPRFCDALLFHTHHDFYRGVAHLTKGFILNEAYRVAELMELTSPDDPVDDPAER